MLGFRPKPPAPEPEPIVGFVTMSDALVIVGILKAEYTSAREMADIDPSWMAQAQLLERVIPVFEQSDMIVFE